MGHKKSSSIKLVYSWDEVPAQFDVIMAARLFGKTPDNVSRLCQKGKIPAHKIGNEWRFDKDIIKSFIYNQIKMNYTGDLPYESFADVILKKRY